MAVEYKVAWKGATEQLTDDDGIRATEAQAGSMVTNFRWMTPALTRVAIEASIGNLIASAAQGQKADTAIQQIQPGANIVIDNTNPLRPIISGQAGGGGGGGVSMVQVSADAATGLTTDGGPVTDTGTIQIKLRPGYSALTDVQVAKIAALKGLANKNKAGMADLDAGGVANNTTFLRGDGFWATVSTGGGLSSVGLSAPASFSVTNSPLTANGTIAFTWASGHNSFLTDERNKLSGIANNATANSTDAFLRARANHTGTQAIATVANLQTTLDGKLAAPGSGALGSTSVPFFPAWSKSTSAGTPTQTLYRGHISGWNGLNSSVMLRDPGGVSYVASPSDTADDLRIANASWVNARFIQKTYGNSSNSAAITLTGPISSDGASRLRFESLASPGFYTWLSNRSLNFGRAGADKWSAFTFRDAGYDGMQLSDPLTQNWFFRKYQQAFGWWMSGGVAPMFRMQQDGNLTIEYAGSVQWAAFGGPSDRKLKENLIPISDGLGTINQLEPYSFTWKSTGKMDYGLVAQEVQEVLPYIVNEIRAGDSDSDPVLGVKYEALIPFLIKAVQELSRKNEELTSRIAKLEARTGEN